MNAWSLDPHNSPSETNRLAPLYLVGPCIVPLKMASSSHFAFTQLAPEVRVMVFTEFFRSLSVTVRDRIWERFYPQTRTVNHVSSYCRILRVNKQFLTEARPRFLPHATLDISPENRGSLDRNLTQLMASFRHIALFTEEHRHDRETCASRWRVNLLHNFLTLNHPYSTKFQSVTYDWIFLTNDLDLKSTSRPIAICSIKLTR